MLWMSLIVCRVYPTALSGRRWTAIGAVHTRPVAKTWQTLKRIRVCSSAIPQNSRATLHVEPLHRPLVLRPATDWCPRTNGWSNKLEFAPRLFALRNAASTQLEQDNGTTVQRDERSRRGDVYTHTHVHTHPHPHRVGVPCHTACVRCHPSHTTPQAGRQNERGCVRACIPRFADCPFVRSFVPRRRRRRPCCRVCPAFARLRRSRAVGCAARARACVCSCGWELGVCVVQHAPRLVR